MKSYLLTGVLAAIFFTSCQQKQPADPKMETEDTTVIGKAAVVISQKECFRFVQKKDTILLSFEKIGPEVNGELYFDNYEKDSSHGPVSGIFSGDTLKLDYKFEAEGSSSEREVFLLNRDGSLLMGTGEMKDQDGKMVFADRKSLKYDSGIVLSKVECAQDKAVPN